ncbi:MAG: 4Fe-4S binding protein [bacterium]|nr:4Fe-4S binding protein [bacterium]
MNRRDFLKLSMAASAYPALLSGCGFKEIRELGAANPGATPAHLKIVEFYSQKILYGPPPSQEFLELIVHLYTPEEAEIVQHLPLIYGKTARSVARRAKRPPEEVTVILNRLANEKRALIVFGKGEPEKILSYISDFRSNLTFTAPEEPLRYGLMPIVPGTFEMVMMSGNDDEWHRRFGQLFERVYNTGYLPKYLDKPLPLIRYIPVYETIDAVPAALPSDLLTEMLKENSNFGVGFCQCRQSQAYAGHDCGLPRETCMSIGPVADFMLSRNLQRRIDRSEALDIKMKANAAGLATFSINVDFNLPNYTCSCCGCCCLILRTISEFNAPALVAPPHFRPQRDKSKCVRCGLCRDRCPMKAWVMNETGWEYRRERCIGCGVCASLCPAKALSMQPVKNYQRPPANLFSLGLRMGPGYAHHLLTSSGS